MAKSSAIVNPRQAIQSFFLGGVVSRVGRQNGLSARCCEKAESELLLPCLGSRILRSPLRPSGIFMSCTYLPDLRRTYGHRSFPADSSARRRFHREASEDVDQWQVDQRRFWKDLSHLQSRHRRSSGTSGGGRSRRHRASRENRTPSLRARSLAADDRIRTRSHDLETH